MLKPWIPPSCKLGVAEHTGNASILEAGAGGSEVQGRLLLPREFEASLGYVRPVSKT